MKKIFVKYKEITLGELTYNEVCFCYKAYEEEVSKANKLGYPISLYNVDKSFVDNKLPFSLDDFIPEENTKLYNLAKIIKTDNDFEKLYKVASLNLDDSGLYVSV